MPNQDNTDPNKNSSTPQAGQPSSVFPQSDLPPLPPEFLHVEPETTNTPGSPFGSAAPGNIVPPIIPPAPKKKFGGGRIIATILGLFLLVGGVGAGLLLTQQQQIFQPKAAGCGGCSGGSVCNTNTGECERKITSSTGNTTTHVTDNQGNIGSVTSGTGSNQVCSPGENRTCQLTGQTGVETCNSAGTAWGACVVTQSNAAAIDSCGTGRECKNYSGGTACLNAQGEVNSCTSATGVQGSCCVPITTAATTCTTAANCPSNYGCVAGKCVAPAGNCSSYTSATKSCFVTTSIGFAPDNTTRCNGAHWTTCASGYTCQTQGTTSDCVPGGGGTTTTTSTPGPTAQCVNVTAYSTTWTALTPIDLSGLAAGTTINFCVAGSADSGTFDKARFKINTTLEAETTTKRPTSNDFCQSYTILPNDTTVNVQAKIHHSTLGWFGETI